MQYYISAVEFALFIILVAGRAAMLRRKRREYYGDEPTPYDNVNEETGNITANWWKKFNALNAIQRKQIEAIIAEQKFTDEDIDVSDKKIKEVLRFYQIQRDKS